MDRAVIGAAIALAALFSCSGKPEPVSNSPYQFTDINSIACTNIKNQGNTSTCWCFSAIAQIESELIQNGKGELDLSEMYVVRHAYLEKAIKYIRMNGIGNISQRGEPFDAFSVIEKYGIVPENAYPVIETYSRKDIDKGIREYLDGVLETKPISQNWQTGFNDLLDKFFGKLPQTFMIDEKSFTPKEYADHLGIKPSNYTSYTSFSHHPFYHPFVMELPDNWLWSQTENIPLDEMIKLIDSTLDNGHTVLWGADISEPGYKPRKGYAIMLDSVYIDQDIRQRFFDDHSTTDDHDMLIVGSAIDQDGNKFYKVRNSYGTKGAYNGYFYASLHYIKAKTILIMIPK